MCEPIHLSLIMLMDILQATHRAGGRAPEGEGSHVCQYCREPMPSKRSLGQHIQNQHAAEAGKDRADREAEREANPASMEWTPAEHALFMDGLERFGPSNNRDIAKLVRSKNIRQVSSHKANFLRKNPDWTTHHPPPDPMPLDLGI